jgi:hypothetical protein
VGTENAAAGLPWERDAGEASGTGICLSGGGVRAAAFALGVLQGLQAKRGLLFGPKAADHLAVVSGGSYIGATLCMNAAALQSADPDSGSLPPLDPDSPEAAHVVSHGRYLLDGGSLKAAGRFLGPSAINFVAVAVLFLWSGAMLADLAIVAHLVGIDPPREELLRWVVAAGALLGGRVILRNAYKDEAAKTRWLPLAGGLLVFACAPALIATARDTWLWFAAIGAAGLVTALWRAGQAVLQRGQLRPTLLVFFGTLLVSIPRVVGFWLLAFAATSVYDALLRATEASATTSEVGYAAILFFGALILGVVFSEVSHRASLHRAYRDSLARCFAVRRRGSGVAPGADVALSDVAPPPCGSEGSFPRLLVCATANVRWRTGKAWHTFVPFVFSHDRCGVPKVPGASFDTRTLEHGRVPRALFHGGDEPLVSLMTTVATTGAAISPSMGRKTIEAVRPLIAVLNVRLGRWLPNPLSAHVRRDTATHTSPWKVFKGTLLGRGWDEFVPEMFGLHQTDGMRVYVSDGGHYDNLGLLALLHARCEEIWCVDSAADKHGGAHQLRDVIELAKSDLGVRISLPHLDDFKATGGYAGATHALGSIDYGGGHTGRIVVIKLALTSKAPKPLIAYAQRDGLFPYAGTFPHQFFGHDRFDAYRKLGAWNAGKACDAVAGAAPAQPVAG